MPSKRQQEGHRAPSKTSASKRPAAKRRAALPTRERILNAARALYARQNYSNVRTADISEASEANVALVNYYFGSKDDLFLQILRQACAGVAEARGRVLDELLARDPRPGMQALVQAWMAPVFEQIHQDGSRLIFSHLLSLVFSSEINESVRQTMRDAFQQVDARYAAVMHQVRPDLSLEVLHWRMLAAIGTFSMVLGHPELIMLVRDDPLRTPDREIDVHRELLASLVALLGAPPSAPVRP